MLNHAGERFGQPAMDRLVPGSGERVLGVAGAPALHRWRRPSEAPPVSRTGAV